MSWFRRHWLLISVLLLLSLLWNRGTYSNLATSGTNVPSYPVTIDLMVTILMLVVLVAGARRLIRRLLAKRRRT